MSLVLTEGFDLSTSFAALGWTSSVAGNGTNTFVAGRIAGSAVTITTGNTSGEQLVKNLGQNLTSIVFGFAMQMAVVAGTPARILSFLDSVTEQISLRTDAAGKLTINRGGSQSATGTVLATETALGTVAGVWAYYELKVTFGAGVAGAYALRRNGSVVPGIPDVAATNTIATANTYMNQIMIVGGTSSLTAMTFDDLYLLNNNGSGLTNFLGDSRVVSLLPTAAGGATNMTKVGASATNWQSVNENPPNDDTTYVQSSVVGGLDTYAYADLPGSTSSVLAVHARPDVRKDDVGTRTVTVHVRSNGSEADAVGSLSPATTYALLGQVMETNPVTGAAWTVADVNAAEFGVKILS